jgi:hypothetical protein
VICAACSQPEADLAFGPQRSLVEIVAELESVRDADTYRFDPPLDVTGENLFRASLARLERFEAVLPDSRYRPVVLLARATARERLLDFAGAAAIYRELVETGGDAGPRAAERLPFAERLAALCEPLPEAKAPLELIAASDARRGELVAERERNASDPRVRLIDAAIERLDVRRREYLWRFRALVQDGTARAVEAARDVARTHAESRRVLRLGDFYAELATSQFAAVDPHDYAFDTARALDLVRAAAEVYAQVAAVDGRVEREEARAKLAALEALGQRLRAPDAEGGP